MFRRRNPSSEKEIHQRLQKIKDQLDQLQQMKRLLMAEGIKPDDEDKRKESKYIQQILGFERDLKRMSAPNLSGDTRSEKKPRMSRARSKA